MRWLADENFNNDLLRALLRRQPEIDIVRVQDVGLSGANDASVLAWAAQQDRVLLTHDMSTVTAEAYSAHGEPRTNARGFRSLTLGCNLPSGRGHSFAHGV